MAGAVERPREGSPVGADHLDVHAFEGQPIARLRQQVLGVRPRFLVGRKRGHHFRRRFERRAVVDERADRKPPLKFRHAAVVILVQVRDQEVVDALQPASRTAATMRSGSRALTRVPGVDEQRLPGRRDDERGLSALDVDEVDVERFRRGSGERAGGQREGEDTAVSFIGRFSSGRFCHW